MKRTIIILTLLIFAGCRERQEVSGWDIYKLRGKVRAVETIVYETGEELWDVPPAADIYSDRYVWEFDSKGKIVRIDRFDPEGVNYHSEEYRYEKGRLSGYIDYLNGIAGLTREYIYSGNKQVRSLWYDGDGSLFSTVEYQYDDTENEVTGYNTSADGILVSVIIYRSDDFYPLSEVYYDRDGEEEYRVTYRYSGSVPTEIIMESPGTYFTPVFEQFFSHDGMYVVMERNGSRDDNGNYNLVGAVTYEYEFDATGNWIKCTGRDEQSGDVVNRTLRKIYYY